MRTWDELYEAALTKLNPRTVSPFIGRCRGGDRNGKRKYLLRRLHGYRVFAWNVRGTRRHCGDDHRRRKPDPPDRLSDGKPETRNAMRRLPGADDAAGPGERFNRNPHRVSGGADHYSQRTRPRVVGQGAVQ